MEKRARDPGFSITLDGLLKKFLFFFLIFLPFQDLPQTVLASQMGKSSWVNLVNYADEFVFIAALFFIFILFLVKPSSSKIILFPWNKFFLLFFLAAGLSLAVNAVPPFQALFGTYDVLKNLVVVYLFSLLHYTREEFQAILRALLRVAFVLSLVGIVAEVLAMAYHLGIGVLVFKVKRFGLYRVTSLAGQGNWNYLGVYLVLLFFLGVPILEKTFKRWRYQAAVLAAILLTLSRQTWIGFGLMLTAKKKQLMVISLIVFLFVFYSFTTDRMSYNPDRYYRGFTFGESLRLLKENPVFGVGPGMFGGLASVLFKSPHYDSWPKSFKQMVQSLRNIDLFWPWVWAEFGVLGTIAYLFIWLSMFLWIRRTRKFFRERGDRLLSETGWVLQYYILALFVMGFAGGLNSAFVVFTYFALLGIYASVYRGTAHENPAGQ
jgi:hypothetical protein